MAWKLVSQAFHIEALTTFRPSLSLLATAPTASDQCARDNIEIDFGFHCRAIADQQRRCLGHGGGATRSRISSWKNQKPCKNQVFEAQGIAGVHPKLI